MLKASRNKIRLYHFDKKVKGCVSFFMENSSQSCKASVKKLSN